MFLRTLFSALIYVLTSAESTYAQGSPGCGNDHSNIAGQASQIVHIQSSGGDRQFLVHVPGNYKKSASTPLIVSYHGNHQTASYQEQLSQFSDPKYNPDWLAVYPQGVNNSWESAPYAVAGVSDLQFTTDLLKYMTDNFCVDTTRIYANGKSNGGGFCDLLACRSEGGAFAAFAPVSGAFYTDASAGNCHRSRPSIPVLEFHGADDNVIPYDGGTSHGAPLPNIPDWLYRWGVVRDKCDPNQKEVKEEYNNVVQRTTYYNADKQPLVRGYRIQGLEHDWPSTHPNGDTDHPTVIEATVVILQWFKKWHL